MKASDTDSFRRKWDKEEYAKRAEEKDEEVRKRAEENDARIKQGKKPRKGHKGDLPKPTELMKQRDAPLNLDTNLNKIMVVQNPGGRGPGQPGFYCKTCNRTYKDSVGYLDHINSRAHLRVLGQTTKVERSTLTQVQERIAYLREKTKNAALAKAFDFDQRLAKVKKEMEALRRQRKIEKKAAKEKSRLAVMENADSNMTALMGFGGFGSSKK